MISGLAVDVPVPGDDLVNTRDFDPSKVAFSTVVTDGNYTTYMDPTYDGYPLGWDGINYTQYYVADCWCIEIGHDNYQQATLYGSMELNSEYWTYRPAGVDDIGDFYAYLKVMCRDN